MRHIHYTALLALLLSAAPASAQSAEVKADTCVTTLDLNGSMLSDARRTLHRALSVTAQPQNSHLFRAASLTEVVCIDRFPFLARWGTGSTRNNLTVLPIQLSVSNHSALPRSSNDAGAWQGAGMNLGAAAGFRAQWRFIHASIAPEIFYAANQDFEFVRSTRTGKTEFADPYHVDIDYPTRFGADAISTITPGQSYLQARYRNLSATVSSENLWIGAAHVNPILMSYTAPGFGHVRLGTQKPVDVFFARLEFQLIMGSLRESGYFDGDPRNDSHYFTTSMAVIEPKFAPGLFLGVARSYHDPEKATGHSLSFYTSRIIETPFGDTYGGNRPGNALGVLLFRYVHPASDFEAYAEWGREDTPGGWLDVLREPDWTQAYVLGFQKSFTGSHRLTRLYGELTHLGESAPARGGRGFFSYYTHLMVPQGHTNQGQLLGAAIGPGSDTQLLGVDVFSGSSRSAFRIERTRYDEDTYYRTFSRRWGETRHDAEIALSGSRLQFLGPVEVEAGLSFSRRYGRQFIPLPTEGEDLKENNWSTRLVVGWQPPW